MERGGYFGLYYVGRSGAIEGFYKTVTAAAERDEAAFDRLAAEMGRESSKRRAKQLGLNLAGEDGANIGGIG